MTNQKSWYAEETHSLDWATSHWEALKTAQTKNKTLAKLQITVKPQVINKEQPTFANRWNSIVRSAENKMMQCLIDHLETTQSETRNRIRSVSNQTLVKLKQLDPDRAVEKLKTGLEQAEQTRKLKLKQWTENKKCKANDNGDNNKDKPKNKRNKTTDNK